MSATTEPTLATSPSPPPSKKRKRETLPDEVEVDVNAPEPPSKKALRAAKKSQKRRSKAAKANEPIPDEIKALVKDYFEGDAGQAKGPNPGEKRSEHGIWIGNLPWTATRDSLRTFLKEQGGIEGREITRLHMPAPNATPDSKMRIKPTNKGFAYVDFSTPEVLGKAMGLSETLMGGRKVLIKNAKSFEGRPDKKVETGKEEAARVEKPASKRIFVGNLSFDVTREDLLEHFAQAGEVEDVHMATFEDSGKCKGFAWVRFAEVEAAEAAVKGFISKTSAEDQDSGSESEIETGSVDDGPAVSSSTMAAGAVSSDESDAEKPTPASKKARAHKSNKKQKWFINRLHGRPLRCEFAEDSQLRYKKRFGSAKTDANPTSEQTRPSRPYNAGTSGTEETPNGDAELSALVQEAAAARMNAKKGKQAGQDKEQRRAERSKRHLDARSIKPGQALANAPRASGAIVAGAGKKTTFD